MLLTCLECYKHRYKNSQLHSSLEGSLRGTTKDILKLTTLKSTKPPVLLLKGATSICVTVALESPSPLDRYFHGVPLHPCPFLQPPCPIPHHLGNLASLRLLSCPVLGSHPPLSKVPTAPCPLIPIYLSFL